ncbi:MAG: glycine dehydrogenase, partial [Roseiarcus sp.]
MRYLPLDKSEREAMLIRIGAPDIETLFADIPADKRIQGLLDLPLGMSEMAVERAMTAIAGRSLAAGSAPFFLGSGAYRRHIPATVDHLIQRSEFLTSYTPYQPEIAQGTLQVLFEFQTQVAALTGMEVANASMYDGSTACGEAMLMAHRLTRRNRSVISGGLHPQYADVCATLAHMAGDRIVRLAPDLKASEDI